ncbi:MAG: NAD(P)H-hydrate dehydratase [Planctomycetes bacterium]|nr:NAD(P)H-hydrate dehydratase [Planctomycetota bacterium]
MSPSSRTPEHPVRLEVVRSIPRLPVRPLDSHKGDYGRVLVVAGSVGMAGAAALCADSALRCGAGCVHLALPEPLAPVLAVKTTCPTLLPLPATPRGAIAPSAAPPLLDLSTRCDAAAIGPGLSTDDGPAALLHTLLPGLRIPVVLDADALTLIGPEHGRLSARPAPTVLTPHPGEMSRLTGTSSPEIKADREKFAVALARRTRGVVCLKGRATVVTDGAKIYRNQTGNPGMATGGSGDVLTGAIGAFLARGLPAFDAAVLGVYLHGLAGDLAALRVGFESLIATDLLESLPEAFLRSGRSARRLLSGARRARR